MPSHVALIRGINVSRTTRIAMADLRALLSRIGLTEVRTHLQSGNAVFSVPPTVAPGCEGLVERIEGAVRDGFGLSVRCVVRTRDELRATIDANPFPEHAGAGSKLLAVFLSAVPDPQLLATHNPVLLDPDRIRLSGRVMYQWCPDGVLAAPPAASYAEKHLGVVATARNWNTAVKLGALLGG